MRFASGLSSKNIIKPDVVKSWRKYAGILRKYAYNLPESSDYLEKWLSGELPAKPLLEVEVIGQYVGATLAAASESDHGHVLDLAPLVSTVRVTKARGLRRLAPVEFGEASAMARYVYPLAAQLVKAHSIQWSKALKIAHDCWDKSPHDANTHEPVAVMMDGDGEQIEDDNAGGADYDIFEGADNDGGDRE